jgi:mRNA interferase MazF
VPTRGDIVLARFPFTDQATAKLRPTPVLAEVPGAYDDFLVMFISSQLSQAVAGFDVILDLSHPSFRSSGLKVASVFRVAKVASLSNALIVGHLGRLDPVVFSDIIRRLTHFIRAGRPPGTSLNGNSSSV